ncbi:cupin domain-containing protein [Brevibacillus ginsengisoli]|uniref:cupin domain-containing protein n=1 Tax=Brevibacillus ginsengisoli TaxID=363854 RepID=UPI003CFA0D39
MTHITLQLKRNIPGLQKIWHSANETCRLIEGYLSPGDEIGPHTHPLGEDCAIVLSGRLTYYLSNTRTMEVGPGEVVFGFQNVIHGYANLYKEPVHLLIFATPKDTGLAYPSENDPAVIHLPDHARVLSPASKPASTRESAYSSFSFVDVEEVYELPHEEGMTNVFVDFEQKQVHIFDNLPVSLHVDFGAEKKFLRYQVRS